MAIELIEHWEVAVDCIQIFLCILILFFMIRNHRQMMKPDLANPKPESDEDFKHQVFSQALNQQVEMAFANIQEVAAAERRNLDKAMQFYPPRRADRKASEILPQGLQSPREGRFQKGKKTAGSDDHQARIHKLANRGMSSKQISEELKTPLGEVELILSFQEK